MKLADALGLNYAEKSAPAAYEVDTLKFYASHKAFGDDVERALNEFINSSRNGMILPPAKKEHRKFTHELAAVYKLATESVDAEPKRSVSVRRLQGSRIPAPLLSEAWANAVALHGSASVASTKLSTAPIDRNKAAHPAGSSSGGGGASSALPVPANQPLNAIVLENVFGHSASSLRETLQQSLPTNVMPAFSMRWVTDENVLLTFDQGVPPTLVRIRSLIRDLLSRTGLATQALLCVVNKEGTVLRTEEDGGAVTAVASGHHSGTATPRLAVGGLDSSLGRTTSSAGAAGAGPSGTSAGAAPKKLGGWAAIASGAATTQSSRLNQASTSVWDSGAGRRAPGSGATAGPSSAATRANGQSALGPATTSRLVLGGASSSARSSPRINSEVTLGFSREVTPDDWETS
ncbi:FKBP12-associated protein [Tilletia horrida]|uniref:FKBP12-associated protein n=1 Tax=Tilletia horrida TaxID=155126 RepID=A0AAN6JSQ3_9BASI|nr:FKBP12-associated protein [Tilletia horrida]KAK0555266.1 FKBP12-associated protein [Tilletia horrida]